jgi:hypothetical protein
MKTTIIIFPSYIPDELYRRVKAKAVLQGKRLREVTIELYQRWLAEKTPEQAAPGSSSCDARLCAFVRYNANAPRPVCPR